MIDEEHCPRKFYKYRSMGSIGNNELFEKNEIYFSNPAEMNDPFECRPVLTADTSPQAMTAYLKYLERKHLSGTPCEERRKLLRDAARRISSPEEREDLHNWTVNKYGFYCLSELPDHPLMWAHYADMHRGFCVEFDTEADEERYFARALPVQCERCPEPARSRL